MWGNAFTLNKSGPRIPFQYDHKDNNTISISMWCPIMKIHVRRSVDYLGGLVQDCSISIANTGDAAVFHRSYLNHADKGNYCGIHRETLSQPSRFSQERGALDTAHNRAKMHTTGQKHTWSRLLVRIIASLCNLTGMSAAVLLRCLSNFGAIRQ